MDDEAGAVATWEAILELPETPTTYYAWREIAAARVRDGDLQGAIAAYREADRRAPLADKPEIANRLGWLAKETGNVRASRRYFARGRGSVLPLATYVILGITIAVSMTAILSLRRTAVIYDALPLDKEAVADGEFWRLWTVTLVHGGEPDQPIFALLHLGFNMYALYLTGPLVEQIYGPIRMVLLLPRRRARRIGRLVAFGPAELGVGASGAIFGIFGVLFVASRLHLPMLDRRGMALLRQVGLADRHQHPHRLLPRIRRQRRPHRRPGRRAPHGRCVPAGRRVDARRGDAVHRVAAGDSRGNRRADRRARVVHVDRVLGLGLGGFWVASAVAKDVDDGGDRVL